MALTTASSDTVAHVLNFAAAAARANVGGPEGFGPGTLVVVCADRATELVLRNVSGVATVRHAALEGHGEHGAWPLVATLYAATSLGYDLLVVDPSRPWAGGDPWDACYARGEDSVLLRVNASRRASKESQRSTRVEG